MRRTRSCKTKNRGNLSSPQEALLIEAVTEMLGERVLCASAGLAQLAMTAARALPRTDLSCTYLDLYRANLAVEHWRDRPVNLHVRCASDLPAVKTEVVAFTFSTGGEADLTRDLIQAGHQQLHLGGRTYAAVENRNDMWLGGGTE